ncbi:MAG: C-GCAxxG-C-C family protein [Chloroflexota bacterium]|nr:C-GCAxxG-C-C family protein [Chloroflexota bacterium]
MLAVGEHYFGRVPEPLVRVSCIFGGGIGVSYKEVCGVLSGGVIILGALWGRVSSQENDDWIQDLTCQYRDAFMEANGGVSTCEVIRESMPEENKRCLPIIQSGIRILVPLIEEALEDHPPLSDLYAGTGRWQKGL